MAIWETAIGICPSDDEDLPLSVVSAWDVSTRVAHADAGTPSPGDQGVPAEQHRHSMNTQLMSPGYLNKQNI